MSKITSYVLKLLSKKDYTENEIRRKLTMRDFDAAEIEESLKFLKNHNFIDDKRYAQNYQRIHQSRGSIRIKFELLKKGIAEEIITGILDSQDRESQVKHAMVVAESWIQRKRPSIADKYKFRANIMAKLSRQGFTYDVIVEAMDRLIAD